jgi:AcrR family transcriptional regulator
VTVDVSPLRQRRRATAIREILDAAEEQIAVDGPAGLSLRSIARRLGMTVQALYHYFPGRDALITELIRLAYQDLADEVGAGEPDFVTAAVAYRNWALANRARFQLIYGTPLPRYRAPLDGGTTDGARRFAAVFIRALFGEFSDEQLARTEVSPLSPAVRARFSDLAPESLGGLPPNALALFISMWGHVHGLVVLEVFGHTDFIGADAQDEVFRNTMIDLLADAHRRIPAR